MRTEPFTGDALSCDDFLGGRLRLWQPRDGYRAGVDPILLAAAVPARTGDSVLDLGCGAGPAMLALAVRVPGVQICGVEVQLGYADLARRNAALNGIAADVTCADLSDLPSGLRQRQFMHVLANPPYFSAGSRVAAEDAGRETGLATDRPVADWVAAAARRTDPRGTVTMIQRAERLPELLTAFQAHLRSVRVLPLAPRAHRDPKLVIVQARRQGNAAFRLHAPLVLHEGAAHKGDFEAYNPDIKAILRDGAALAMPR